MQDSLPEACLVFTGYEEDHCLVSTQQEDSIFHVIQTTPKVRFITKDADTPVIIEPLTIEQPGFISQFFALLIAGSILIYIRIVRKGFYKNLKSVFNSRLLFKQMIRDNLLFPLPVRLLLFIACMLTFSVLLFQADAIFLTDGYYNQAEELIRLTFFFTVITITISAKYLTHWIIGHIYKTQSITKEYLTNSFYYNTIGTIILIPFLLFSSITRSEIALYFIFSIALILILLRTYRSLTLLIGFEEFSVYQKFVYFCTLEIFPWLVIYKLIAGRVFEQ